jgi:hypothetical protein
MTEVASSLPMQMMLVDVAHLARVHRPVVSVWRGRKRSPCSTPSVIKLVLEQMESIAPRYAADRT